MHGTAQPPTEDERSTPLVSIVIAARNAAATLPETLDSLRAQTYPHWETFVVDDGSVDETAEVVAAYADADGRIDLLKGESRGVSAARNIGLRATGGDWLLFLDADDWIEPQHLELMVQAVRDRPDAVAAFCRWDYFKPDGRFVPSSFNPRFPDEPFETFASTCYVAIHSVLVRNAVVKWLGGFDEDLRTCEDWDLWQRLARRGGSWVFVDAFLSHYRMSANSLSRNLAQLLKDAETVVRRGYIEDSRVPDPQDRYRSGLAASNGRSADATVAEVAMWYGAVEWMSGRDASIPLSVLERLPTPTAETQRTLSEMLFYGTARALDVDVGEVANRWPAVAPSAKELIALLAGFWNDPVAERRMLYRLEGAILECADLSQPRKLDLTLGLPLVLGRMVEIPQGVDRLHLRVMKGRWTGTHADIGVLGTVSDAEIRRQILDHYGPLRMVHAVPPKALPGLAAKSALRFPGALVRQLRAERRTGLTPAALPRVLGEAAWNAIIGTEDHRPGTHGAAFDALRRHAGGSDGVPAAADLREAKRNVEKAARPPVRKGSAFEGESRAHMPVLMYHRIAEDGPEALWRYRTSPAVFEEQVRWLSGNGYHAIDSPELYRILRRREAFRGRPVLLTFDDGFQDFADSAWPILRGYGMTAEVFIVTDLVGKSSEWDRRRGGDFPLMTAKTIIGLHREGARFGSHLATHRGADALSTRELAEELLKSRAALARWLGAPPRSIAAPFGLTDKRMRRLAAEAGYDTCFSTRNDAVSLTSRPLDLPRIEVRGDLPIDAFVASLEALL